MTRVVRQARLAPDAVAVALRPRGGFVIEREVAPGVFDAEVGPVRTYRREVVTEAAADGRVDVRQTVEFRLLAPFTAWLFVLPTRRLVGRIGPEPARPWWSPPDTLDSRSSMVLSLAAVLAVVTGYQGTLITQTITFAAGQFGSPDGAQGVALAFTRLDVLLFVPLVALADRRGRRRIALATAVAGTLFTATGALAPSLAALTATQVLARGCITATVLAVAVIAAEEMPAGARAYAVSVLALASAFGGGLCVMALPLADVAVGGWRVIYLLPLLFLPVLRSVGRSLPESRRFDVRARNVSMAGHRGRLALLATSALLLTMFSTPASQFLNEFLRDERGFSAARISAFTLLTNTPGIIGVAVGARLADARGRRGVAAVAVVGGTVLTVLQYGSTGVALWAFSITQAITAGAALPALGVYGPELFPTALRGRANGILSVLGRVGSVAGLVAVGFLSDRLGGLGNALAVLAVFPLLLAVLVIVAYPETAHRSLEELNPEDPQPV